MIGVLLEPGRALVQPPAEGVAQEGGVGELAGLVL
jgi:hypothetical protein